mgnify:FL=1
MPVTCQSCGMVSKTDDACEWCGVVFPRTGPPLSPEDEVEETPFLFIEPLGVRLEWFLAVALLLVAAAMAAAHRWPGASGAAASIASLGVCFVLSLYQIVESVDAQFVSAGLGLILCILFGPAGAAVFFAAAWIGGWRGASATVLVLLAAHFATRFIVIYSALPEAGIALERAGWALGTEAANSSFAAALAGWALANFWRPLNE